MFVAPRPTREALYIVVNVGKMVMSARFCSQGSRPSNQTDLVMFPVDNCWKERFLFGYKDSFLMMFFNVSDPNDI